MKFLNPLADSMKIMPLNIIYHKGEIKKWNDDSIDIIYKDMTTNKKYVDTINNPFIEVNIVKPEYRDKYTYMRDYAPVYETETVRVHYKTMNFELSKITGVPKDEIKYCPWIFGSDIKIESFYFINFLMEYGNDDLKQLSVGFFDIENDIIEMRDGEKFTEYGNYPTNAITYVDEERMQCYTLLLTSVNPVLYRKTSNPAINKEREECLEKWNNQVPRFMDNVDSFIDGLHERHDEAFGVFDYHILFFEKEIDLIKAFWDIVNASDNDFVQVWNLPYDAQTLIARIIKLGYDPREIICNREFRTPVVYFKEDTNPKVHKRRHTCLMSIMPVLTDQMVNYGGVRSAMGAIPSFKLNSIAKIVLNDEKQDYSESGNIRTLCYNDYVLFVIYNIKDVLLQYGIHKKTSDIVDIYNRMYNNGLLVNEVFTTTAMLTNAFRKFLPSKGLVLGNNRNKLYSNESNSYIVHDFDDDPDIEETDRIINGEDEEGNEKETQFEGAFISDTARMSPTGFKIFGQDAKYVHNHVIDMDDRFTVCPLAQ